MLIHKINGHTSYDFKKHEERVALRSEQREREELEHAELAKQRMDKLKALCSSPATMQQLIGIGEEFGLNGVRRRRRRSARNVSNTSMKMT